MEELQKKNVDNEEIVKEMMGITVNCAGSLILKLVRDMEGTNQTPVEREIALTYMNACKDYVKLYIEYMFEEIDEIISNV